MHSPVYNHSKCYWSIDGLTPIADNKNRQGFLKSKYAQKDQCGRRRRSQRSIQCPVHSNTFFKASSNHTTACNHGLLSMSAAKARATQGTACMSFCSTEHTCRERHRSGRGRCCRRGESEYWRATSTARNPAKKKCNENVSNPQDHWLQSCLFRWSGGWCGISGEPSALLQNFLWLNECVCCVGGGGVGKIALNLTRRLFFSLLFKLEVENLQRLTFQKYMPPTCFLRRRTSVSHFLKFAVGDLC